MTTAPLQLGAPVPAILWESLQDAMNRSVRRLVKDVGAALGVPDKSIYDELFRSGDALVRPYLFEEAEPCDLECRCLYPVQKPDAPLLLQACAQPILWSLGTRGPREPRCPEHFGANPPGIDPGLPTLNAVEVEGEEGPLYKGEDDTVYDSSFCPKGRFEKGSKRLFLFHIEE